MQSLFLVDIGEPGHNDLRIVVSEGKAGPPLMTMMGEVTPIQPDATSRTFELIWYSYVAYSVRNESYLRREEGAVEEKVGGLGVRCNSAYLAYVAATTFATDDFPGNLTHWSLGTEWHCIDVVSVDPPEIRLLRLSEEQ